MTNGPLSLTFSRLILLVKPTGNPPTITFKINVVTEELERIVSEIITYTQGFIFSSFETKNIIVNEEENKTESKIQKYHNILACGYDIKESYSITEITYIPTSLNIQKKELERQLWLCILMIRNIIYLVMKLLMFLRNDLI